MVFILDERQLTLGLSIGVVVVVGTEAFMGRVRTPYSQGGRLTSIKTKPA